MFLKNKIIVALGVICGTLGFESSFAESSKNNDSSTVSLAEPNMKILSRTSTNDYAHHIKDLEFHRSLNGGATFDVIFEEIIGDFNDYDTKISKDGYTLTITFNDTSISDKWVSNIDTKVFNTIVDAIKVRKDGDKVIFVIHALDRISLTDLKDNNTFTFKVERHKSRVDDFNMNEPISISFKDAPVDTVLQVLAEFAGMNLVVSSSVRGNVSVDLKNVPWNEVLNIVLVSKGLATKKMNSILYVATAAEISAQQQLELQTKRSLENNADLFTAFIPLNYTTAQVAQTVITSMAKQNGGIMSARGSVTSDARTNTLIVTDTEEKIPGIKEVIKEIDIPNDQVLIETRIVQADRTSKLNLGFNYGIKDLGGISSLALNTMGDVAEGAIASTMKGAWTIFGGVQLTMEIQASESLEISNEVASPHLVVANNETASISQGTRVPYNQSTSSGAASVAFIDALLELEVTPQIAPDSNVILEVKVTKNSAGSPKAVTSGEGDKKVTSIMPPEINTREIVTKIMTKSGSTVVIGGIYEKVQKEDKVKIPFLGDIPYIGYLFSHTSITNTDRELLVFITPKVIEGKIE